MQPSHGPYPPTTAGLGGEPTKALDVSITSVFLLLFILGAVTHMTILQVNLRRGHKFITSGLLFGFCMARIVTCIMRLVWTAHLTNINIAIAAQIFVSAGVLVLFIVNLIFTQRIIRATHPSLGWAKTFLWAYEALYACIILMLAAIITCTIQSFFTLSTNTRRIDRDVQLVVATSFATAAFLPIPLILISIIFPRNVRIENFGTGRFRTKIFVLLFSSVILTLGAAFRAGIAYKPHPRDDPAWYDSKACFYLFNFTIEIIVVTLYAAIRVDKRFHVPNKSHGPGDFSRATLLTKAKQQQSFPELEKASTLANRVLSEEQVFHDQASMRASTMSLTQLGTTEEKFIDIESGIVLPMPRPLLSRHNSQSSSHRWSVNTIADIDSILIKPSPPRFRAGSQSNRSMVSATESI